MLDACYCFSFRDVKMLKIISAKWLSNILFPTLVLGIMLLLGIDFLYTLFSTGHANTDLEKEMAGLLTAYFGHWITKKNNNDKDKKEVEK